MTLTLPLTITVISVWKDYAKTILSIFLVRRARGLSFAQLKKKRKAKCM